MPAPAVAALTAAACVCLALGSAGGRAGPAAPGPGAAPSTSPYSAPVADPVVLAFAALPERPWDRGHRGVDLAAPPGTPVLAPADGTVTFSGRVVDRAVVTIAHADGLRSSVEPVTATAPVGAHVLRGQPVGVTTPGGHCDDRCLHWGVRRGEAYLDPLALLRPSVPSVLLP